MFRKYMHLERLGNTEVEGIDIGEVWVFPKLDGTNGQIWWDKEKGLMAGSRNRVLSLGKDNAGFCAHVLSDVRYHNFFRYNSHLTLYGEWLVPHTLQTYKDTAWRKFYIFDVADKEGNLLHYKQYQDNLEGWGLDYLSPIQILNNPSEEQINKTLERNTYLIKDGFGVGEGVVLKNYSFVNRFGRVVWAKVITNSFKENHGKVMGVATIGSDLVENDIVEMFITQHFVEKVIAKITLEKGDWSSACIGQLLGIVWYDFVREEMFEVTKKFKNPQIDFKKLNKLVIAKVKQLRGDLF